MTSLRFEGLQLWPQIACPLRSTVLLRVRALLALPPLPGAAGEDDRNWQQLMVQIVAQPRLTVPPPKRLAPSFSWSATEHFSPNSTAAGLAHSIGVFRAVGMTTIPQMAAQGVNPTADVNNTFFATPAQRASDPVWAGLKYAPEISAFYHSFNGKGKIRRRRV